MPPVFFVSYARADAEYAPDREDLTKFVNDLSAKVRARIGAPLDGVRFFDASSIEVGDVWTTELADALMTASVGVALCTPTYFTRPWCGKEFQVFVNRAQATPGASGIIPVLWMKCPTLPPAVSRYQHKDDAFPPEYAQVGLQRLLRLNIYHDQYEMAIDAVADRIHSAAKRALAPLSALDFETVQSAWDAAVAANPRSHTEGSLSKTCFVFVSKQGWDWEPYPANTPKIGALAQRISGELGLRYEEIKCDGTLRSKLEETNQGSVPTILFGDPGSLLDPAYSVPMQEYDRQFLLNCAALVPWDEASRQAGESDVRWAHLKSTVCRQKTAVPPPYHEWRSIFSPEDLELKTRTTIEELRSRLMKQLMSEPVSSAKAAVRKAEDEGATLQAAALGIRTESLAQLEAPTK